MSGRQDDIRVGLTWTTTAHGVSVGVLVDDVCTLLLKLRDWMNPPRRLMVSAQMYEAIVHERQAELKRGNPLMILDLDVAVDPALSDNEVAVE